MYLFSELTKAADCAIPSSNENPCKGNMKCRSAECDCADDEYYKAENLCESSKYVMETCVCWVGGKRVTVNPIDKPTQGNGEGKRGNDVRSTQLNG